MTKYEEGGAVLENQSVAEILYHLPLELGDAACGNLSIELPSLTKSRVFLVNHDISRARHVVLVQTFDIQPDVVTRICEVYPRVVHFYGKHFSSARVRRSVCR